MPCAFGVPGSTISGSGCVVGAQRRGREGRRIAPACLSVLVSAATYLAQAGSRRKPFSNATSSRTMSRFGLLSPSGER